MLTVTNWSRNHLRKKRFSDSFSKELSEIRVLEDHQWEQDVHGLDRCLKCDELLSAQNISSKCEKNSRTVTIDTETTSLQTSLEGAKIRTVDEFAKEYLNVPPRESNKDRTDAMKLSLDFSVRCPSGTANADNG